MQAVDLIMVYGFMQLYFNTPNKTFLLADMIKERMKTDKAHKSPSKMLCYNESPFSQTHEKQCFVCVYIYMHACMHACVYV